MNRKIPPTDFMVRGYPLCVYRGGVCVWGGGAAKLVGSARQVSSSGVPRVNTVAGRLGGHGVTGLVVVASEVGDVTGSGGEVERMAGIVCYEA